MFFLRQQFRRVPIDLTTTVFHQRAALQNSTWLDFWEIEWGSENRRRPENRNKRNAKRRSLFSVVGSLGISTLSSFLFFSFPSLYYSLPICYPLALVYRAFVDITGVTVPYWAGFVLFFHCFQTLIFVLIFVDLNDSSACLLACLIREPPRFKQKLETRI